MPKPEQQPRWSKKESLDNGVIIFFGPNAAPSSEQKQIIKAQKLVKGKMGGWSTHVGILNRKEDEHYLAHSTEKHEEGHPDYVLGYVEEPIDEMLKRDEIEGKQKSWVTFGPDFETIYKAYGDLFNPKFKELFKIEEFKKLHQHYLARSSSEEHNENLKKIKWTDRALQFVSFKNNIFAHSNKHVGKIKKHENSTICSEFSARALKITHENLFVHICTIVGENPEKYTYTQIPGYPANMFSNASPKSWFNHLIKNPFYKSYRHVDQQTFLYVANKIKLLLPEKNQQQLEQIIKNASGKDRVDPNDVGDLFSLACNNLQKKQLKTFYDYAKLIAFDEKSINEFVENHKNTIKIMDKPENEGDKPKTLTRATKVSNIGELYRQALKDSKSKDRKSDEEEIPTIQPK